MSFTLCMSYSIYILILNYRNYLRIFLVPNYYQFSVIIFNLMQLDHWNMLKERRCVSATDIVIFNLRNFRTDLKLKAVLSKKYPDECKFLV